MKAFVTLLSDERYLDGVVVLKRSLLAVKSQYPLYCVLSADIEESVEKRLNQEDIQCIKLTNLVEVPDKIASEHSYSHWNKTFDKLQIWGLTQFEKLVFLDSDLLIVNNIDSLFEHKSFSGVCAGKSFPGNASWKGINSGVMVVKPNLEVERKLIELIPVVSQECKNKAIPIGDQDVIQRYLTDSWDNTPSLQLDEGYNIFADFLKYYIKELGYSWSDKSDKVIYIVHFIGRGKPWMKLSLRGNCWLLKNMICNPYYMTARRKFRAYLSNK